MKFAASLIVAVATVAASTADACWLRTNPSVKFSSFKGAQLTGEMGMTVVEQDQKLCKENVRLDVFKNSADATSGFMCVRGKAAQRDFCNGKAVACCAPAKLSEKAKAARVTGGAPSVVPAGTLATAITDAVNATAPADTQNPVVASTETAQIVDTTPTTDNENPGAVLPAELQPAVIAAAGGVLPAVIGAVGGDLPLANTTATGTAAATGSDGAQTARAGCWKQLSGVVHFASLAGVNLSSDAGLTNVFTDNALCDSEARVDVHTSDANEKFGMVCVRGQEAQRKFCGGKVACCTPGAFVSA